VDAEAIVTEQRLKDIGYTIDVAGPADVRDAARELLAEVRRLRESVDPSLPHDELKTE
jgi:hypothetical protein